jgi:hypothetical protein
MRRSASLGTRPTRSDSHRTRGNIPREPLPRFPSRWRCSLCPRKRLRIQTYPHLGRGRSCHPHMLGYREGRSSGTAGPAAARVGRFEVV